ncbi:MAG: hypothetical protein RI907_253 [Pseudomonadota bacterium]|jgi:hypothetical protein
MTCLLRASLRPGFALTLTCALAASAAQAQTSYTATELKAPFASLPNACDHANGRSLGDNGDVVSLCNYAAGYTTAPQYFGLLPVAYQASRPTVWRVGKSAAALSVPANTDGKKFLGVTSTGRILGVIGEIVRPNKAVSTPDTLVWWEPNGSTRTPFSPGPGNWSLSNVTAGGRVAGAISGFEPGAPARIHLFQGNGAQSQPLPPDVAARRAWLMVTPVDQTPHFRLNDAGQIVIQTAQVDDTTQIKVWLGLGANWRELPPVQGDTWSRPILRDLNSQGQVLLSTDGDEQPLHMHVWSSNSGWRNADAPNVTWLDGTLTANGEVVGSAQFSQAASLGNPGQQRAALWRDGQVIDLNTLVKPPSGQVYTSVLKANAKGQLLVQSLSTAAGTNQARLWLLTPR